MEEGEQFQLKNATLLTSSTNDPLVLQARGSFKRITDRISHLDSLKKKLIQQSNHANSELLSRVNVLKDKHNIDLLEVSPKGDKKDVEEEDSDSHSFILEVNHHKTEEVNKKRKESIASEFGLKGTVEDYDCWAQEMIAYINDNHYRELLKETLGMELDQNGLVAQ